MPRADWPPRAASAARRPRPTPLPRPGEETVTDADGNTTAIFHDDQGNLGTLIDPLGNITAIHL